LHPDLITKLYKRIAKLKKDEPSKKHAALARHIIDEDTAVGSFYKPIKGEWFMFVMVLKMVWA